MSRTHALHDHGDAASAVDRSTHRMLASPQLRTPLRRAPYTNIKSSAVALFSSGEFAQSLIELLALRDATREQRTSLGYTDTSRDTMKSLLIAQLVFSGLGLLLTMILLALGGVQRERLNRLQARAITKACDKCAAAAPLCSPLRCVCLGPSDRTAPPGKCTCKLCAARLHDGGARAVRGAWRGARELGGAVQVRSRSQGPARLALQVAQLDRHALRLWHRRHHDRRGGVPRVGAKIHRDTHGPAHRHRDWLQLGTASHPAALRKERSLVWSPCALSPSRGGVRAAKVRCDQFRAY